MMNYMLPNQAQAIPSAVVIVYACQRTITNGDKTRTVAFTTTNKAEASRPDVKVIGSHICQILSGVFEDLEFPDTAERIEVANLNGSFCQEGW